MASNLFKRGFLSLVATQFFGAMNDNVLKGVLMFMVIDGAWAGQLGEGGQGLVSVFFTIPFILLSGIAGQIADRHSKRTVTQWVKIVEIPIAIVAAIGFYTGSLWVTLLALIALTCQSSFFGPAKYGMIPELVEDSDLSRANGTINMMTNAAVIVGTLAAGIVSDRYSPQPSIVEVPTGYVVRFESGDDQAEAVEMRSKLADDGIQQLAVSKIEGEDEENATSFAVDVGPVPEEKLAIAESETIVALNPLGVRWLPGLGFILIAICGLVSALQMVPLAVGDKNLKYDWNPFSTYFDTIKEMSKSRLLMVMMAWAYFYLLAGIALLIVPEYTVVLGISRADASILMGVLGVSIGVGCAVAGLISGHHIEPRLIPIGAAGLVLFFALLAAVPPSLPDLPGLFRVALSNVAFLIFGAGFFAGFYIIPLQALLQKLSPDDERGRFLGTANAVSFTFLTVAALLYWAIRPAFGDEPQNIFYLSSLLMALGSAFFLWKLRGTGLLLGAKSEQQGNQNEAE